MMNILNGGAHADSNVDIQEFMIAPIGAATFAEALRWGAEVYHALKAVLKSQGPGHRPRRRGRLRPEPAEQPGRARPDRRGGRARPASGLGTDIAFALDAAATEFYSDGAYQFEGADRSAEWMTAYYEGLVADYPLVSIEDPLSEDDWAGWIAPHRRARRPGADRRRRPVRHQPGRGCSAASTRTPPTRCWSRSTRSASSTETLDAVSLAHRSGFRCMMSHRSGETEDTTIADLAVATDCGQIKTGAPARSERVAKYNQLLRIEEELDDAARYAGRSAFPRFNG